jgi:hypothetical protein
MADPIIPPQFAAEVEAVLNALDDPSLSPVAFARLVITQIAEMQFSPECIVTVRYDLLAFEKQVRMYGNDDAVALRHAALQLLRRAQALARPMPVPQPADVVRRLFESFQQLGWASATLEILACDLKLGEKVLSFDADGVTTDSRRIEKEDLIVRYRPLSMTENHFKAWRKQHTRDAALYTNPTVGSDSRR